MDFWASLEHKLRYNKKIPPEMMNALSRELNECATESAELDYRMQNVKNTFLGKGKQRDKNKIAWQEYTSYKKIGRAHV